MGMTERGTNSLQRSPVRTAASGSQIASEIAQRGRAALKMLLDAREFASNVGRDAWDFALEIWVLHESGLNHTDLRWLICRGLLASAVEVRTDGNSGRSFQQVGELRLSRHSCCILKEEGVAFVRDLLGPAATTSGAGGSSLETTVSLHGEAPILEVPGVIPRPISWTRPTWDPDRQELRVGEHVVKQFKVPAPNQESVLAAFDEDNWPVRIDDPLPPRAELDSKRRLHDTIVSLNRKQKVRLVRFIGDGSGQGVRWEFVTRRS